MPIDKRDVFTFDVMPLSKTFKIISLSVFIPNCFQIHTLSLQYKYCVVKNLTTQFSMKETKR